MKHKEIADANNLRLLGYEGGCHFQLDARQKPYESVIREVLASEAMGAHYALFGEWWKREINDVLCWYNDVSVGPFGAKTLEHGPTSPRFDAIMQMMNANA